MISEIESVPTMVLKGLLLLIFLIFQNLNVVSENKWKNSKGLFVVRSLEKHLNYIDLFNSNQPEKSINKPVSILTDNDKFPASKRKEYSFDNLLVEDYKILDELDAAIQGAEVSSRIPNITSVINKKETIKIFFAEKTLEYELALANIPKTKEGVENNFLFKYIKNKRPEKAEAILNYIDAVITEELTDDQQRKAAILLWKSFPPKGAFSQNFSLYILKNLKRARKEFIIPKYILKSLKHLKGTE